MFTDRDNRTAPLLAGSMAPCSARSNRGPSPCSPRNGGLRVAPVAPHAVNLTGPARDAAAMPGRNALDLAHRQATCI